MIVKKKCYKSQEICEQLTDERSKDFSEMTFFQQAFLYGLLKEKEQKNIEDWSVDTTVILICFRIIESNIEMYTVDLAEKWYMVN